MSVPDEFLTNDSKVINFQDVLEASLPHTLSEVICIRCYHRWIAIRPVGTKLKNIECPRCGPGAVIETGENIDNCIDECIDS